MINFKGICDGLAAQFAAGTISTPSGASAMRSATGQMPKSAPTVPMVFVEVTDGTVVANDGSIWVHEMHMDVVFLYSKRQGDTVREDAERQRWLPALLAATESKLKIGIGAQAGYEVLKAIPTGWVWAEENVGGSSYDAIRVHYSIFVNETVSLAA